MRFVYGKQDMRTLTRSQEVGYMLTNGLGGYSSVMAGFGVPRCDQGILVAAVKAPNVRINMVHRLCEKLTVGDKELFLSTQEFADGTPAEIFSKVEQLKEVSLAVPQVTELLYMLECDGYQMPRGILHAMDAAEVLTQKLKK